jgi:hypothetical protein
MKAIFIFFSLITLASCGMSGSDSKSEGVGSSPFSIELTEEESKLVRFLLKKEILQEKEIVKLLISLNQLNEGSLSKLDNSIEVKCLKGICEITKKDMK